MAVFDILAVLVSPGSAIGCAAGVGIAVGLRWLFPTENLIFAQALIVAVCCAVGAMLEGRMSGDDRDN